jgi:thioredoxin reductase (NADPH)
VPVLSPDALRRVVAEEPALGELILRTFLRRRARLARLGAGMQVIGFTLQRAHAPVA